jgi:hypothetical protein
MSGPSWNCPNCGSTLESEHILTIDSFKDSTLVLKRTFTGNHHCGTCKIDWVLGYQKKNIQSMLQQLRQLPQDPRSDATGCY